MSETSELPWVPPPHGTCISLKIPDSPSFETAVTQCVVQDTPLDKSAIYKNNTASYGSATPEIYQTSDDIAIFNSGRSTLHILKGTTVIDLGPG